MDGEKWLVLGFLAREKWDALSKECGRVWLPSSYMSPISYVWMDLNKNNTFIKVSYLSQQLAIPSNLKSESYISVSRFQQGKVSKSLWCHICRCVMPRDIKFHGSHSFSQLTLHRETETPTSVSKQQLGNHHRHRYCYHHLSNPIYYTTFTFGFDIQQSYS